MSSVFSRSPTPAFLPLFVSLCVLVSSEMRIPDMHPVKREHSNKGTQSYSSPSPSHTLKSIESNRIDQEEKEKEVNIHVEHTTNTCGWEHIAHSSDERFVCVACHCECGLINRSYLLLLPPHHPPLFRLLLFSSLLLVLSLYASFLFLVSPLIVSAHYDYR